MEWGLSNLGNFFRGALSVSVNFSHHRVIHKPQTRRMESDRKGRKRSDYAYFLSYRTRWFVIPTKTVVALGELTLPIQDRQ